jgi:hypothetical protein
MELPGLWNPGCLEVLGGSKAPSLGLTLWLDVVALAPMNTKLVVGLLGVLILVAGCVKTVSDRHTAGVPWVKDTVTGHYERPLDQVYDAAKEVVKTNGRLLNESVIHAETNVVKTVQGKVNDRTVWVRVEQADPNVTAVAVQTRTPGGASDINLAHELEKQIALKLVH